MLFAKLFFNVIDIVRILEILLKLCLNDLFCSAPLKAEYGFAQCPAEMEKGLALESVGNVNIKAGNEAVFFVGP